MARFEPFPGIRYDRSRVDLAQIIAPPYDVVDDALWGDLAARSPYNSIRIDHPAGEVGARQDGEPGEDRNDRYEAAARRLRAWQAQGILVTDDRPTFTVYRMAYTDDAGRAQHTTGVIGALELSPPGNDILPHEHTTPKARSDRLDMLRFCRANTSAIWGLSLAKGLTDLLPMDDPPTLDVADELGARHTAWIVDDPEALATIATVVAAKPVVIADGHHRYETSLAYRAERAEADGGDPGLAAMTLAYVVELVEDELTVRAIHRLVSGLADRFDVVAALDPWFEPIGPPPESVPVTAAMADAGALCVVLAEREVLVRPRPEALADARDLDSVRLDVGLASLPPHQLRFEHEPESVRRAVHAGEAQAGVLLRPATVPQIAATAHGGERMPPKTTFFHPKPRTGLVFRGLG